MKVLKEEAYLVASDVGTMKVTKQRVQDYDIDDLVHDMAMSQATSIQLMNIGQELDPTAPTTPRVVKSHYSNNTERLPD